MMSKDWNIWQWAEGFVSDTLTPDQQQELQTRLGTDQYFAAEFQECVQLLQTLTGSSKHYQYASLLKDIAKETTAAPQNKVIAFVATHWRTAAVAAGVALITSASAGWMHHDDKKATSSQYSLLRREIETIKRSQNQLIQNIKNQNQPAPAPKARYTGTGFAITNDGYLVTNHHVTDGADSVYIQTNDGNSHKAYVIASDAQSDIAILKVESKSFRFGKGEVPYTFATTKAHLGAKVYTLGFPQDDIVYNEGYISARNGFEGDSLQYRLELPANPGQSGAPVIDNKGNILAIITGKETQTEGTTYAVSTHALLQLLYSMPKAVNLHIPKHNKMTNLSHDEQIEKMQNYTCIVQVFKK